MDHEPTQNESYNESLIDFPRTVINDFDESMEFIDSRTQIPSGNSISFWELIDNDYKTPLSFLDMSRYDYISSNELSDDLFCPDINAKSNKWLNYLRSSMHVCLHTKLSTY